MEEFSNLSIAMSTGSKPIEASKARMNVAVRKFEESYAAYITYKAKSSPIPRVTLKQIISSYNATMENSGISSRGDNFGKAVEQLLLESVIEECQSRTELGRKPTTATDSMKKFVSKAGDFVGKLLPLAIVACGMAAAMGDASVMASPLKAVANGTALVLQLAQKEKDRKEDLINELDRISYQSRRVFEIQKLPRDSLNLLLLEKSLDLMTEVINFLASSLRYWKHGFFMNVTKSVLLGPEVWQSAIKALHLAYEEYDQALLLQIASRIETQRNQLQDFTADQKDNDLLQWLKPSVWEVESQLLANRSQKTDGTLDWVLELEEFKIWRLAETKKSPSSPSQTLWITGLPGTGKSTISAFLYDLLACQYPDDIVLHFFCKSGTPGLTTAHNIVRTLCYQITQKHDFYRRYLQEKPQLPGVGQPKSLAVLINVLLKEPLFKGPQGSRIIILLDGLDELEDSERLAERPSYDNKTEVEILLDHLCLIPKVKILITSRSSPELKKVLSKTGIIRNITWRDNSVDIERYVKSRIASSPRLASGFQQINMDPVEFFSERSNGIFLWVALILDILERTISTKSFSSALESVPLTMNSVYDRILDRAIQSGNYKWIREVLGWTLILPSSFTVDQMKAAVEYSMDDELIDIEDLLRNECGSLLSLIPVPGNSQSLEIHISHETFQAYLKNSADSRSELFSANIAHGKAALGCLRYLAIERSSSNNAFQPHALTRWRWHLRHSVGLGERIFAEPLTNLESGIPLPAKLSREILVSLHKFLTSHNVDKWLDYYMKDDSRHSEHHFIWNEIYHTCIEVSAWYRTNKLSLESSPSLVGVDSDLKSILRWCRGIPKLQCIVDKLWLRACRIWLWNTYPGWMNVQNGYEALVRLNIWANHPQVLIENGKAAALLKAEETIIKQNETRGWKMSGNLSGNITLRYANSYLIFKEEAGERKHFDAIAEAGGFDEMSAVCQSNLAVACFFLYRHGGLSEAEYFQESLTRIQDILDEDPSANPRHWETLARIYKFQDKKELAVDAFQAGIRVDPHCLTGCREGYYSLKKGMLMEEKDYDAAITLLEEAIREDPGNANCRWFHQMADLYKMKGDLEGARRTYRANMEFDPKWNSQWKDLAKTYIDKKVFDETREFDWHGFCDALADATLADPRRADNHWDVWLEQAKDMRGYQHFDTAVKMLEYGIEKTSLMKTQSAIKAQPAFEFLLGETYCSMSRFDLAVPLLEDALKHEWLGRKSALYIALGQAYTFCSRYEEALAAFNKLVEYDPEQADAYKFSGDVHLISGNLSKVVKEYKNAIRLQETWVAKHEGSRSYPNSLDKSLGEWYADLGAVYERLSRPGPARACFEKALPHAEYITQKMTSFRAADPDGPEVWVHRSDGRNHMKLAWLYEKLYPGDQKVEERYELAVWVFKTAVYIEDDFLEEAECAEAEEALARVKRGEPWVFPGVEADKKLREQETARTYRVNWGVNLERRKRGTKHSMMRGH